MISHDYKCIFIHIPKTAGQSVESVFLDFLGLSWEARAPLLLRPNENPNLGPPRLAHLSVTEYLKFHYVSNEQYDNYFKFAFVRNPWDRMVSIYKYSRYSLFCDFDFFIRRIFIDRIWRNMYWFVKPQSDFIADKDGNILIDYVGRFESLQEDFFQICDSLKISRTNLPYVNKSSQFIQKPNLNIKEIGRFLLWQIIGKKIPTHSNYQSYYSITTRKLVEDVYKRDILLFNYTFE